MNEPERLTLPEPAHALWARTAAAVRTSLREIDVDRYAMGGGTILGARWGKHRRSYDIDVIIRPEPRIVLLASRQPTGFRARIEALGGTVDTRGLEAGLIRATFGEGPEAQGIDIWAHRLQLEGAETNAVVDGRTETVLSTAQILWGKIKRGMEALPRDVYDVVEAGRREPETLQIAANAHPREHADGVALQWEHRNETIAREAASRIDGVPEQKRQRFFNLGQRASNTLYDAFYTELKLERDGHSIHLETSTRKTGARTRTANGPTAAERLLIAEGLTEHRGEYGPYMQDVVRYAVAECASGEGSEQVYLERRGHPIAWRTAEGGMSQDMANGPAPRPERVSGSAAEQTRRQKTPAWKR